MKRAIVVSLLAGLALFLVASYGASRLRVKARSKQAPSDARKAQQEREYQEQLKDATPVQVGVMTDQQRIHSKLYASYKTKRGHLRTISGLAEAAKASGSKFARDVATIPDVVLNPNTPRETAEDYFADFARDSDLVVRGVVTHKISQITEDDEYIFTDYRVSVIGVIKNNPASPVSVSAAITVTRPCGKVLLDGVIVSAEDEAFQPLPTDGQEVFLFLRYIPESGTYTEARDNEGSLGKGSFRLGGSVVQPLTRLDFPLGVFVSSNPQSFIQTIQAVSNR
jgi:hypothetical protein